MLEAFYYITFGIVITVVVMTITKLKNVITFAVLFPIFYIMYSFIAPLGVIGGADSALYTPLHEEVFHLRNDESLYITHAVLLLFLIFWYIGFFWRFRVYKSKMTINDIAKRDIISMLLVVFMVSISSIYILYNFQFIYTSMLSGSSVYRAYSFYNTPSIVKATYSLWGSSIVTFSVIIFSKMKSRFMLNFLIINIMLYSVISLIIGDRGQLIVVLLGLLVSYSILVYRLKLFKLMLTALAFIGILSFIRIFRGINILEIVKNPEIITSVFSLQGMFNTLFASGENIAAYLSIYFFTNNQFDYAYGESFLYLLLSFIPRFILSARPSDFSYHEIYVNVANLPEGRGYTLHQVSDWYLNFGLIGVVVGGLFLGWVMRKIEQGATTDRKRVNLVNIAIFSLACGWLPQLMRVGVEGYKAFIYEYTLVPFIFLVFIPKILKIFAKSR
jgi:oligosaccharide repeat unit polymerase